MADALCGPSNALQSFQKHSQVDRTLQQDRLTTARQTPSQGFRSHDPRAGSLDADFRAFETAQPRPFVAEESLIHQNFQYGSAQSHPMLGGPSINWAADFQRLHISEQPIPAQQFRAEAPLIRSTTGGWQNEFMRQRHHNTNTVASERQIPFDQPQSFGTPAMQQYYMHGGLQQQVPMNGQIGQADFQQSQGDQMSGVQQYRHDASVQDWSQAFEEAFESSTMAENTILTDEQHILHEDGTYTNDRSQMDDHSKIQQPDNIRIGSDAINYTEMRDRTDEQNAQDAGALARVAGELLHNVQHENDNKFQNSQFLDLMRKIRDRQVEVRNNDFETIQGESISAKPQSEIPIPAVSEQITYEFVFPDMNLVHEPDPADLIGDGFNSDQYPSQSQPLSQIHALHPGGRRYPGSPIRIIGGNGYAPSHQSGKPNEISPVASASQVASAAAERTTLA